MKNLNNTYWILAILLVLTSLASCSNPQENKSRVSILPYYNDASFTPQWLEPSSGVLDTFHKIPDFSLTNQDDEEVTGQTFSNKIYVTDFFFTTCPGICPKMTDNFVKIQDAFKTEDKVMLLSHSVTPARDSVPQLKLYAEEKGVISGKWHLVTGDQATIYNLGRQQYFVEEDLGLEREEDEFLHTENFILVDQNKHIRGIYNGLNNASVDQLIIDIRLLINSL